MMIEYENLSRANRPFFEEFRKNFSGTLDSGWYILGKNVSNFEQEFAAYLSAGRQGIQGGPGGNENKFCVGVASGLDALTLSLKAFTCGQAGVDFPPDSEVIVPSNTYIATILSILHCGLIPVLVEPDIRTYNIAPEKIEERISKKTKAVMVVHLYGKACEMNPIMDICKKHGLLLIEDCAQSHGAEYKGIKTGNFGIAAFSFYPTKNLGALGDAGAIVTANAAWENIFRKLRNYGSSVKYYNDLAGYNSRLDEVQAGFLSVKLKKLDEIISHKRKLAEIYLKNLKSDYILPDVHPDFFDVYHIFNVRHPRRDELKEYLLKNEIRTEIHYPLPPHRQKAMQGILRGKYPLSEEIHATTLSLPVSYAHTENEIMKVVEVMNKF